MSDYFLALSDHYKAVRARLNGGPPPRPVALTIPTDWPVSEPAPEPEPPAPPPAPPVPLVYLPPRTAKRVACAALVPHGMTFEQAMGPSRTAPYVAARASVYHALRAHGWSLMKIGIFCGRDHTTVMNALQPKKDRTK